MHAYKLLVGICIVMVALVLVVPMISEHIQRERCLANPPPWAGVLDGDKGSCFTYSTITSKLSLFLPSLGLLFVGIWLVVFGFTSRSIVSLRRSQDFD